MFKKIVLGTLLVGLIAVLVTGAVMRTIDKTGNVAEAQGIGRGYQRSAESGEPGGRGGQGYGRQGQSGGSALGLAVADQVEAEDWVTVEGNVIQAPAAGEELVIRTDDGAEIAVGTGPGTMEAQGFTLQAGERVQVSGYRQEDEIAAAQVTRLSDGATIALRDQAGRPMWAGGGRGQGARGQGGAADPGSAPGVGQAEVSEWVTVHGTVTSVDPDALVIQGSGGEEVVVENRPWWFAQEQGFSSQVGDQVTVRGFYDEDLFEAGEIADATNGQSVVIRDENGRPMWAGRGGRSG
jgi:uncharacterized protein YdeI (BOF family)